MALHQQKCGHTKFWAEELRIYNMCMVKIILYSTVVAFIYSGGRSVSSMASNVDTLCHGLVCMKQLGRLLKRLLIYQPSTCAKKISIYYAIVTAIVWRRNERV